MSKASRVKRQRTAAREKELTLLSQLIEMKSKLDVYEQDVKRLAWIKDHIPSWAIYPYTSVAPDNAARVNERIDSYLEADMAEQLTLFDIVQTTEKDTLSEKITRYRNKLTDQSCATCVSFEEHVGHGNFLEGSCISGDETEGNADASLYDPYTKGHNCESYEDYDDMVDRDLFDKEMSKD